MLKDLFCTHQVEGLVSLPKSRTPLAKILFFKKNPSKIRINPFVVKKSRTLFPMSELPLAPGKVKFLLQIYTKFLD